MFKKVILLIILAPILIRRRRIVQMISVVGNILVDLLDDRLVHFRSFAHFLLDDIQNIL